MNSDGCIRDEVRIRVITLAKIENDLAVVDSSLIRTVPVLVS